MDINQLPPELIQCIGDHLRRAPLNALIQTSKRHAKILTFLLYQKAFRRHFRPAIDNEPEPRARSIWVYSRGRSYVSQRRLWACAPHWESEYVMDYFNNRSLGWAQTRFGGRERNGATWLHLLAAAGHEKLLKMFITKGLDINSRDWAGNTVLHSAVAAEQHGLIEFLLQGGADVLAINSTNQSVLVYALVRYKIGALIPIIDAVKARGGDLNYNANGSGHPPIFLATRTAEALPVIKKFLENGVNVFQILSTGAAGNNDTLLHWACRYGHHEIGNFLVSQMSSRPGFISLLNDRHMAPIHLAICHKSLSLSKTLIAAGANLDDGDQIGSTPLDLAIDHRRSGLFQEIYLKCNYKDTAFQKFKQVLSDSIKDEHPLVIRHLLDLQAPCSIQFPLPTLHHLIENHGNTISGCQIIELIGDAMPPTNFHIRSQPLGETPLHLALRKSLHNIPINSDRLITYLLLKTRTLTLLTREGNSILHHAALFSTPKTISQILAHKNTTHELFFLENKAGKTALQEAARRTGNHRKITDALFHARTKFDRLRKREKNIANSPRKIGKPAVPDPPVRREESPQVLKKREKEERERRGSCVESEMGRRDSDADKEERRRMTEYSDD
ncbi:hypothetical protein BCIN_08g05440 [Botrytis cinerea B05.10]|uniref:protein S-acyltransferase n=3 Tax=Botryotinia fuckeliana TaxID=40559 RepID=A0A384JRA8_BOTFB|nr:hypothetical protein BCIN_08g05440 [Botrytis cinerea B05.10]ATZ52927.1 hypothetical protein BCIN_08g05440 [Botrytis cinerea B05.10]EMR85556.1 putative ankyrin repeat domain protein [Botrytis cinerea BcDW1]CCD42461.1 hypothetical protein BofuT4_P075440.1 [Botrytis cinerea T4]